MVAGLVAAIALLLSGCVSGAGSGATTTVTKTASGPSSSTAPSSSTPTPTVAAEPKTMVHIKTLNEDGATYGVGMPVIAFFTKRITSAKSLQDDTIVTVNGKPMKGAWYFETSNYYPGYPIEGHLRLQQYWPEHSLVHIGLPMEGKSAGAGMAFDNNLTLDFLTGARNIAVVNDANNKMTVTSDGKLWGTFPVSLGSKKTPTLRGTKVIMEKGKSVRMKGPGYDECCVKYTQRLTYGGEYLHSAPWNTYHIRAGVNSSNGCTNLLPADAERLYHFLRVGDVVQYPNADGPAMSLGDGYGDWNIDWGIWQTGGLVSTLE